MKGENRQSHSAIGHQVLEDEVHFISILKAPKMKNQHHFCAKERLSDGGITALNVKRVVCSGMRKHLLFIKLA